MPFDCRIARINFNKFCVVRGNAQSDGVGVAPLKKGLCAELGHTHRDANAESEQDCDGPRLILTGFQRGAAINAFMQFYTRPAFREF